MPMIVKKGQLHASTKVAATIAKPRRSKKDTHTKGASRVRPSAESVRRRTNPANRAKGQPGRSSTDADALLRAEAKTAQARIERDLAIAELHESQNLRPLDWFLVTCFIVAVIGISFLLGRLG